MQMKATKSSSQHLPSYQVPKFQKYSPDKLSNFTNDFKVVIQLPAPAKKTKLLMRNIANFWERNMVDLRSTTKNWM